MRSHDKTRKLVISSPLKGKEMNHSTLSQCGGWRWTGSYQKEAQPLFLHLSHAYDTHVLPDSAGTCRNPADRCHFQLTRSKQLYKSKPVFEMHSIPLLLNMEGVWERERETEGKSRGFEFCFCTLRPWNLNWLTFPSSCCCLNNLLWSKRHTVQRKQAVCSVLVWPQGGWEDETRETFVLLSVSHTNVFKPHVFYLFFCHFVVVMFHSVVVLSIWFSLSFCLSKFILSIILSVCYLSFCFFLFQSFCLYW